MENKTILIVDDTITNLDILVELLDVYNTMDVTNGDDALDILEEEKIDLILLDIMMPDMDGFEVCRRVKSNPLTKDVPIVFITSDKTEKTLTEAYTLGAIDFINKPFYQSEILHKVSYILSNTQSKYAKDLLTGVRDRKNFLENSSFKFKENQKDLRAVLIDIDNLQDINEMYGNEYGDKVIQITVKAIREVICKDSVFGRVDANGFMMVCSLPTLEAVKYSIKFIKDSIQDKTINTLNGILNWKVSIGVATRNTDMQNIEALLNISYNALREAKNSGKDRIVYAN
ncbi:MAG: response regulator [Campylobacterota bacterium]|nr:response regulator [Campylobacterota bacterium]